jgi:peptidoglycan/xylan/chitin deacetylase (PgdA/CDA1 family)
MIKRFCFTADVDRDVNECVPGRTAAVSLRSGGARYTSSESGVNILLDMLDDIGMNATFFAEARTLNNIDAAFGNNEVAMHGLDHEDMTGQVSGVTLSENELNEILQRSHEIIKDRTGKAPKGFRAPYMRSNETIMRMLPRSGISYDSSEYAELSENMHPYVINGITEIPVPVITDADGKKMFGYLWPMHEGTRTHDEYVRMAHTVKDGVLVLATHSWHMVESRSGMMTATERKKNAGNIRKIITTILDSGFKAARMMDVVR